MYALVNDKGAIVQYPFDLKAAFPDLILQKDPPDAELAAINIVRVRETQPLLASDQSATEIAPAKNAKGIWVQQWSVTQDPDRLAALKGAAKQEVAYLGQQAWLQASAVLGAAYADAADQIDAATTLSEIEAAVANAQK